MRSDLSFCISRSVLMMVEIVRGELHLYAYNIDWEIMENFMKTLAMLSKWSIARDKLA
jgi:hypothetical protein